MAINASAGGKSASITPNRPSWSTMKTNYPGKSTSKYALYAKISAALAKDADKPAYANTCAIRMSYGLIHSGVKLGRALSEHGTIVGDDKNNYWLRVVDLKSELSNRFGSPDQELSLPLIHHSDLNDNAKLANLYNTRMAEAKKFLGANIANKNGIITFEVSGWKDASGHFTLWEGSSNSLLYAPDHDDSTNNTYYFWLTILETDQKGKRRIIQTEKVKFWELK